MSVRNAATAAATTILDVLLAGGVRDLVLCPGSRSAPLALAAHRHARDGDLRLHTRIDERTAAFLALGLARTSRRPVAVLTTSGTAVGHLHPAALEASHSGVPLVLLTADRPAAMRGTGANQTTDYAVGFGAACVAAADVPAGSPGPAEHCADQVRAWRALVRHALVAQARRPGPVHLNVQLPEPLVPDAEDGWTDPRLDAPSSPPTDDRPAVPEPTVLPRGPRTVVVAGDDAGPPARHLAERGGWPLLAEPSSGSRTGANALRSYRALLEVDELTDAVERVVVAGHPTLSRPVTRLLRRGDVEQVALLPRASHPDQPGRRSVTDLGGSLSLVAAALDTEPPAADDTWLARWQAADGAASRAVDAELAGSPVLLPQQVAAAVAAALPPSGLLVVGASNPIRDLDLVHRPTGVGERRLVLANRGLAGIDGTVSTAIGAALARPHSSRALALMGDLTFLHDHGGLLLGPYEQRPDLTLVVVNDRGGSIFAGLEQGGPDHADSFEQVFALPHEIDLEQLCAASRTPYALASSRGELDALLASPNGGTEVVEARVDRSDRRGLDRRLREVAVAAARSALATAG